MNSYTSTIDHFFDKFIRETCNRSELSYSVVEKEFQCKTCLKLNPIAFIHLEKLIEGWDEEIRKGIINQFNTGSNIVDNVKAIFLTRNKSISGLFSKIYNQSKIREISDLSYNIEFFQIGTYLLNMFSEKGIQDSIHTRLKSNNPKIFQNFNLDYVINASKLVFDLKYSYHLIKNDLRKFSVVPIESKFGNLENDLLQFIEAKPSLHLKFSGKKYWYNIYNTPSLRKINLMFSYFGGHEGTKVNIKNITRKEAEKILPPFRQAVSKFKIRENSTLDPIDRTLFDFGVPFYTGLCPSIDYADLFDTRILNHINYQILYNISLQLRNLLNTIKPNMKHLEHGIIEMPINDFINILLQDWKVEIVFEYIAKLVLFIPFRNWFPYVNPLINEVFTYHYGWEARNLVLERIKDIYPNDIFDIPSTDNVLPLSFSDGKSIWVDYTAHFLYSVIGQRYEKQLFNQMRQEDSEIFEKEILTAIFKTQRMEYILEKELTKYCRKVSLPGPTKRGDIDGVALDPTENRVYIIEAKTFMPDPVDAVSKRSVTLMNLKILVEIFGYRLETYSRNSPQITIKEKTTKSSMYTRTNFIRKNWDKLKLFPHHDLTRSQLIFVPLIITNLPPVLNNWTKRRYGYPIISLNDILFKGNLSRYLRWYSTIQLLKPPFQTIFCVLPEKLQVKIIQLKTLLSNI